jgi:hypothetical protein
MSISNIAQNFRINIGYYLLQKSLDKLAGVWYNGKLDARRGGTPVRASIKNTRYLIQ